MIVCLNGKFSNARDAKVSAFDPGFLYGDGIFETLRTYNGKVWQMEDHIARLYESARMRGWVLPWKPDEIAAIILKTIKKNDFRESLARVTVTPGVKQPTFFVWVQPMGSLSAKIYSRGVSTITFPLERPFPQMKTTSLQPLLIARAEMNKKRAFEALLINRKGLITEGTRTNVFIVKKKTLITPKIGVLAGATRNTLLKIAKKLFRIKQRDILRRELMRADECFLTTSPQGIIPVVRIDGEKIGNGRVGPVTKHLQKEFKKFIQNQ